MRSKAICLSSEEKAILGEIDDVYKYMSRDEKGDLFLHKSSPLTTGTKLGRYDNFVMFNHLFQKLENGEYAEIDLLLAVSKPNKDKPMRPAYEGDSYDTSGILVYDTWICPNCEEQYELDYDTYNYCPNCGQKIDWEDKP